MGELEDIHSLCLALHLAFGFKDCGEKCDDLIVAREGHAGFVKRVGAFMRHHGLTEDTKHLVLMRSPISFLEDSGFAELKKAIVDLKRPFRFVLVDTVGRVLPGADMAPIKLFMERLQQIGEITEGVAVGVHHENKSGDANGSMYFQNNSDFMFNVSREDGKLACKITCVKQKDGEDNWSKEIEFAVVELEDGKSSLVVREVSEPDEPHGEPKKKRLTAEQEAMYRLLRNAGPHGLSTEDWNAKAREIGIGSKSTLFSARDALDD